MNRTYVKGKGNIIHIVDYITPEGYKTKCGRFLLHRETQSAKKVAGYVVCKDCAWKDRNK